MFRKQTRERDAGANASVIGIHYPQDRCARLRIRKQVFDVTAASRTELRFCCMRRAALSDFPLGDWVVAKLQLLSGKILKVTGYTAWEADGGLRLQLIQALPRNVLLKEQRLATGRSGGFLLRRLGL